ncbi:MAG: penicillin-binding protein 2 [Microcoleus vaginatus WJT46-NPBG5]|jgi:penicillin-binding protein 2|nr:penicillin-binding protein 2 [Microcoleus vaginatus WJT46-NPBG5]
MYQKQQIESGSITSPVRDALKMASGLFFDTGERGFSTSLLREAERRRHRTHQGILIMLLVSFLMGGYVVRLAHLQLVQGEYNRQKADGNRIRLVPIPSERGNILDRKGKLLAANRLSRAVYLWPKEQLATQWTQTAQQLSPLLNIPAEQIMQKLQKAGFKSMMPVRISRNINQNAFVALAERATEFRGVEIRPESSRYYPTIELAGHVLGYIGEASEEDLEANPDYPMGMLVGKMGIERLVNSKLSGTWGSRLIEVDASGEELRETGVENPVAGESLQLTLDLELQKTAEKALAQRRGAVVVLDVKTGAVLAMASGPSFDPNLFTRQVSDAEWDELQSKDNPFLNRALQGYPPGSTFKIVTAAAGMESGKFTPDSYVATADSINIGGISFHEHGGGFGVIGFEDAFAYSSNTFFYQVGIEAGPEEIAKWGKRLGIGETTDLNLLGLEGGNHGSLPTPAEKEQLFGEPWYAGDTVSMSIGQGLVLTTPLEMAVMVATIANGGKRVKPHLLASQTNTATTKPEPTGLKPETIDAIRKGLIAVVQKGTGQQLNDGSIPLTGGKTGTAEVPGQEDNANYVAFGPADNPQIAIAVIVENGGYGGVAAAPIAHEIFKTYFKK